MQTVYLDSLDIAKRACVHLGCAQILDVEEDSVQNYEITSIYDKLRQAELRRSLWVFSVKRCALRPLDTTTKVIVPELWDDAILYRPGSIVRDANGALWTSTMNANINYAPGTTPAWDTYFGPRSVTLYDEDIAYYAGELVYVATGSTGYVIFMSLISNNEDAPTTATAWDVLVTYKKDDVVKNAGTMWRSLVELNLGQTPSEGPAVWSSETTYTIGNSVTGSDGFRYTALGTTTNHDPVTDAGVHWSTAGVPTAWTALPAQYEADMNWLPIYGSVQSLGILYPLGSGPFSQQGTRNVYMLPNGFLRDLPQQPKAGSTNWLGASSAAPYRDWEYEGEYLITTDADVILYRYMADVTDVRKMDANFCEGLAARIAFETCERITQSGTKKNAIGLSYDRFMKEARMLNAIQGGEIEAPEDDYIACRR